MRRRVEMAERKEEKVPELTIGEERKSVDKRNTNDQSTQKGGKHCHKKRTDKQDENTKSTRKSIKSNSIIDTQPADHAMLFHASIILQQMSALLCLFPLLPLPLPLPYLHPRSRADSLASP